MRFLKMALPAAILAPAVLVIVGGFVAPTPVFSTKKYADDNKKACTYCHVKMGAPAAMHTDPNLTDTGKCFQKNNHSLATCAVPDKK
jgi:hypothetical protein